MLRVISINQSKEWDEVVSSFANYDVYYLSGYVKAFMLNGDGEPILFYYNENCTRGINVVMMRDVAEDCRFHERIAYKQFFDFSTPYGYGGWLIEGEKTDQLFKEYERWCVEHRVVSEFVRFHPVINNHFSSRLFYETITLGPTVSIDLSSKERAWNSLSSKNRNVIRKAINNGIIIRQGLSNSLIGVFKRIYEGTMNERQADGYYFFNNSFYNSILNDLGNNATIFYAQKEERIIAAAIIIYANGMLNYHLSGSIKEFQNLAPTNLLLWKVVEWGCDNGGKTFHLGGGVGCKEDSLFHFKRAFNREELCEYRIGKRIFIQDEYDALVSLSGVTSESFFPQYRAK